MPGTPTIKGDNTVLWGSGGVYGSGIITRGNKQTTGESVLVKDNNGFTVTKIYFDDMNKCSFEMIVQTSAPDFDRGDQITVCGVANCLVDDFNLIFEQAGVRKFTCEATRYLGMTLGS